MMKESIEASIATLQERYADSRLNHFDVTVVEEENGRFMVQGTVLDAGVQTAVLTTLQARFPETEIDTSNLHALSQTPPEFVTVATNLTGLYGTPSWQGEMVSELLNGWQLERLMTDGLWSYVRQEDGYLGWAYSSFLSRVEPPQPTHVVHYLDAHLFDVPNGERLVGKVPIGTAVQVTATQDDWVFLTLTGTREGWTKAKFLRDLATLPEDTSAQREQLIGDAFQLIGTPYLWGGCTAAGIDCSGYSQLLHRLIGIELPRDADMQFVAGHQIEEPYQPGDLLFFGGDGEPRNITHVAISLGGTQIIHSSRGNNGTYVDDISEPGWLRDHLVGACTYFGL